MILDRRDSLLLRTFDSFATGGRRPLSSRIVALVNESFSSERRCAAVRDYRSLRVNRGQFRASKPLVLVVELPNGEGERDKRGKKKAGREERGKSSVEKKGNYRGSIASQGTRGSKDS